MDSAAITRAVKAGRLHRLRRGVWIGPDRVDLLWRDQRLAVETDGWGTHRLMTNMAEESASADALTPSSPLQ